MEIEMFYDEHRGKWELIVDGEWYAEGDYEYIDNMRRNYYA